MLAFLDKFFSMMWHGYYVGKRSCLCWLTFDTLLIFRVPTVRENWKMSGNLCCQGNVREKYYF